MFKKLWAVGFLYSEMSISNLSIPIEGTSLIKAKIVEKINIKIMLTTIIIKVFSHYNLL